MSEELIIFGEWDKARQAIEKCTKVDELKSIRDKASALKAYAKQVGESLEVQNNVSEIRIRAERRIGEFSKELPKEQGKRTDLTSSHDGKKLILSDAGIRHHERYEAIADIPEEIFEKHIQEVKEKGKHTRILIVETDTQKTTFNLLIPMQEIKQFHKYILNE
jgi:hypothetical protein